MNLKWISSRAKNKSLYRRIDCANVFNLGDITIDFRNTAANNKGLSYSNNSATIKDRNCYLDRYTRINSTLHC